MSAAFSVRLISRLRCLCQVHASVAVREYQSQNVKRRSDPTDQEGFNENERERVRIFERGIVPRDRFNQALHPYMSRRRFTPELA